MQASETVHRRYSRVATILHWTIAALIVANLVVGPVMGWVKGPPYLFLLRTHESFGITVLLLSLVRIVWRLTHRPPPFEPGISRLEKTAAHAVHFSLYVLMIVMPIVGWAIVSANPSSTAEARKSVEIASQVIEKTTGQKVRFRSGQPVFYLYGAIPWPVITPIRSMGETPDGVVSQLELHENFVVAHTVGALILLALALLHIAGALKHQLIDRQPQLARMRIGKSLQK
jgi:cytochrome b561